MVTGASRGIGLEAARGLAQLGATVVLTGRNRDRTEAAVADVIATTGNPRVSCLLADFSSLSDVRELADEYLRNHESLHVLIHNAGVWHPRHTLSKDGFEDTFAVNTLAPFLLSQRLLPVMTRSQPARIVNVSSRLHRKVDVSDVLEPKSSRSYRGLHAYSCSKLALQWVTLELARRLQGTGVTANTVHPGDIKSDIVRESRWARWGSVLIGPFLKTPEYGGRNLVYVATAPELDTVSGKYFRDFKERAPSAHALNETAAQTLWTRCAEWAGTTSHGD